MTVNEKKILSQALRPFGESGLLSPATMKGLLSFEPLAENTHPVFLSREAAARLLGVCKQSLINYQKSGTLTPMRLQKRLIRYRLEDVEALLREGPAVVK